jgi:hypothetical protein
MLICKSNSTDTHDHERLREAILKVLPTDVPLTGGLPDICRNWGSARAWLTTTPRLRSDGVTEWWNVDCERGKRQWTCEAPTHSQLVWVYAEVDKILRRLEVSFDDATGLARARALAVRTIQILQDVNAEPLLQCGASPRGEDDRRREWETIRSPFRLMPDDTAVELAVHSADRGVFNVMRDVSLGLTFQDPGDDGRSAEVCWSLWVTVT